MELPILILAAIVSAVVIGIVGAAWQYALERADKSVPIAAVVRWILLLPLLDRILTGRSSSRPLTREGSWSDGGRWNGEGEAAYVAEHGHAGWKLALVVAAAAIAFILLMLKLFS